MSSAAIPSGIGESMSCVLRRFGARPYLTGGDVLALAFAADGTLLSVEEPGVVRSWNLSTQQQTGFFDLEDPATLWALNPAAAVAVAGSDELQAWDLKTGNLVAGWPQASWVSAVSMSPDGKIIATGHDDGFIRLWDLTRGRIAELRAHHQAVSALAFARDGRKLASSSEDKAIHLWNLDTEKPFGSLLGHTDRMPALAWHPDGKRFLSAGWDTTARVWDLANCEPIILLNAHAGQVLTFALSPDGALLACADSANAVHIWDLTSYRVVQTLRSQGGEIRTLAWTPDGKRLAGGGSDRFIHLWDVRQGTALDQPAAAQGSRTNLSVLAGGKQIASLTAGAELRVWDTVTTQPTLQLDKAGALRAFATSPNGKRIAASRVLPGEPESWHEARRGRLEPPAEMLGIWNAETGKLERFLEGPQPPLTALAFAPDSNRLASGGSMSDDVWVWNAADGSPVLLIPDAAGGCSVEALAWHPAGKLLAVSGIDYMATGGSDGKTGIWNVEGRHPIGWIPGGGTAVAYHPRGHHLAIASLVQTVRVWDVSGKEPKPGFELVGHLDVVTCVAYSPEGRLLATGGDDHTVRLWDADTGLQVGQADLDTQVRALAFAPDGKTLFAGNGNTSCYMLDVGKILAEEV